MLFLYELLIYLPYLLLLQEFQILWSLYRKKVRSWSCQAQDCVCATVSVIWHACLSPLLYQQATLAKAVTTTHSQFSRRGNCAVRRLCQNSENFWFILATVNSSLVSIDRWSMGFHICFWVVILISHHSLSVVFYLIFYAECDGDFTQVSGYCLAYIQIMFGFLCSLFLVCFVTLALVQVIRFFQVNISKPSESVSSYSVCNIYICCCFLK